MLLMRMRVGFRPQEPTRLRAMVIEHRAIFLETWDAHFNRSP